MVQVPLSGRAEEHFRRSKGSCSQVSRRMSSRGHPSVHKPIVAVRECISTRADWEGSGVGREEAERSSMCFRDGYEGSGVCGKASVTFVHINLGVRGHYLLIFATLVPILDKKGRKFSSKIWRRKFVVGKTSEGDFSTF